MADSYELDPVDWISAGAVGEPGSRVFYVQARKGADRLVALVVEKGQVAALAQLAQQLLEHAASPSPRRPRRGRPAPRRPGGPGLAGGVASLGADGDAQRFLLEAEGGWSTTRRAPSPASGWGARTSSRWPPTPPGR